MISEGLAGICLINGKCSFKFLSFSDFIFVLLDIVGYSLNIPHLTTLT